MRSAGHVARTGAIRNTYIIFVEKPEGKRLLTRDRHIKEDNIKMALKEVGWGLCVGFIWLKVGNTVMNCNATLWIAGLTGCPEISILPANTNAIPCYTRFLLVLDSRGFD
jgi:hypothetical protein